MDISKGKIKRVLIQIGIDWTKYNLDQVMKGMFVELEHGNENPKTNITNNNFTETLKITIAHLNELPDYYTRLEKMEKSKNKLKEYMEQQIRIIVGQELGKRIDFKCSNNQCGLTWYDFSLNSKCPHCGASGMPINNINVQ